MNIYDPSVVIDENKKEEEGESCYRGFINGHDATISKIIQFKDGKVVTCGYDKKINIFGKLLNNEAKEDFPIIELTEEEKEKLEKERQEKEKHEKLEREKQEKENKNKEKNKEIMKSKKKKKKKIMKKKKKKKKLKMKNLKKNYFI